MASPNPNPKPKPNSLTLPLKTRIQLTLLNLITDSVRRNNFTINRPIMNFIDRQVPPSPIPRHGVATHDVTVDPTTNLTFRLFIPLITLTNPNPIPIPIIIFFHGGGFAFLTSSSHAYDAVCRRFARKLNAVICSVNYRLAPEHKFPAQFDDAFTVLRFIDEHRRKISVWPENADVTRCFLAGDSAGGNIAHNLAVRACTAQFKALRVIGLFNIQPFFGGKEILDSEIRLEGAPIVSQARTAWMWRAFLPDGLGLDHWAVDVSGPNAVDITGLDFPGTVVVVGGFDPLRDRQKRYYEWLKRSGKEVKLVDYPTAIHAFYVFPELPESGLLFAEFKEFIHHQCSKL